MKKITPSICPKCGAKLDYNTPGKRLNCVKCEASYKLNPAKKLKRKSARICANCGEEFNSTHYFQLTCSKKCSHERFSKLASKNYKKSLK